MSKLFLALISLFVYSTSHAFDYSVSGFVGFSYVWSTKEIPYNKTPYDLGVLLSSKLSEDFEANILFRYTGEEDVNHALNFGFLSYHNSIFDIPFEIQGGRFKYDFGLHGGDLSNPRTRPEIISPQSIYWYPLRYTLRNADGFRVMTEINKFQFSASIGSSSSHDKDEEIFAWVNMPRKYLPYSDKELNMEGYLFNTGYSFLKYNGDNNVFKIGYGFIDLNDHISGEYITAGYQFNYEDFSFEAETLLVKPAHKNANKSFFNMDDLSKGHSFTVGYQVTDAVKIYANYNAYDSRSKTLPFFDPQKSLYEDYSVGAMYDINDKLMLRVEVHRSSGSRLVPDEKALFDNSYKEYYMGAVNLTYFF